MRRLLRAATLALVAGSGVLALARPAVAQPTSEAPPPDGEETAPRLVSAPEPVLPPEAFEGREGADVSLELVVDESGAVTEVVVLESAGERLDPLVVEAARAFRFEPARRAGEPVASRVRLRLGLSPSVVAEPRAGESPAPGAPPAPQEGPAEMGVGGGEPVYETVVVGDTFAQDQVRRVLTVDEISHIPGTGGDALKSVQNLPGVARVSGDTGMLVVRGSEPADTHMYIDGVYVPMLYHFGGLTSIVPTGIIEGIDFFPGNFGSRYGNATGGIVEARTRRASMDRWHASADVDLIDAGVLVDGPLTDEVGVIAGVRRSYVDAVLGYVADDLGVDFVTAPVYYDYQLLCDYAPSPDERVRAFLFGSDDRFELILDQPIESDPTIRGSISSVTTFHRLQLRYDRTLPGGIEIHSSLTPSYTAAEFALGNTLSFEGSFPGVQVREEVSIPTADGGAFRVGGDLSATRYRLRARLPRPTKEGEIPDPLAVQRLITTDHHQSLGYAGLFAEHELRATRRLTLVPGIRLEAYNPPGFVLTPRAVGRYQIDGPTVLKAGFGMFARAPDPEETDEAFGTPGLEPEKALHASVGAEREIVPSLDVSLEVFGKSMWDLVTAADRPESERGFDLVNEGEGRAWGLELLVRLAPGGALYGWIAYTLMRSERRSSPDEPWHLFDFDQTHILSLVAGLRLRGGWRIGTRFRYVTGDPDTPVDLAVLDSDADVYVPVFGRANSRRLPAFHQLDVRLDKEWALGPVEGSVYLDVQNAYNRANPEGWLYNFDYTERTSISGLPIIPSLGVEARY